MSRDVPITPEQSELISATRCFQGLRALGNERLFPISLFLADRPRFDSLDDAWGTDEFPQAVASACMLADGAQSLPPEAFGELMRLADQWNSPPPADRHTPPATPPEAAPHALEPHGFDLSLPEEAFSPFLDDPTPSLAPSEPRPAATAPLPSLPNSRAPSPPADAPIPCEPPRSSEPSTLPDLDIDWDGSTTTPAPPADDHGSRPAPVDSGLPGISTPDDTPPPSFDPPSEPIVHGLPEISLPDEAPPPVHFELPSAPSHAEPAPPIPASPAPSEPSPTPTHAKPVVADPKAVLAAIDRRDIAAFAKALPPGSVWPQGQTWSPAAYCAYCDWPQGIVGCRAAGHGLDAPDSSGMAPATWALGRKAWSALGALLDGGASLAPFARKPLAALAVAQGASAELLRKALSRGADPDARDSAGFAPIHLAAAKGLASHCDALAEAGASLDLPDPHGRLPREIARASKHFELAHRLQHQAIHARSKTSASASASASASTSTSTPPSPPKTRPAESARPSASPPKRPSPSPSPSPSPATAATPAPSAPSPEDALFERAVARLDLAELERALRLRRPAGDSAAALCSAAAWPEGLRACREAGRPIDEPDPSGARPIHAACRAESIHCLSTLLSHGAHPDSQTPDGTSPLHLCAQSGWTQGCQALLSAKARLDLLDSSGRSARDLAKDGGHAELAALLTRAKFQRARS